MTRSLKRQVLDPGWTQLMQSQLSTHESIYISNHNLMNSLHDRLGWHQCRCCYTLQWETSAISYILQKRRDIEGNNKD